MIRLTKLLIAASVAFVGISSVYADTNIPNTDDPTTLLGPTVRLGYTSTLNCWTAYSIAGEVGIRNFRVSGTLGFKTPDNQYFKLSAEYLWQKITYAFFSGSTTQWVNQGAVGGAYLYEFSDYDYRPQLGLSAYLSHGPSKTLNDNIGTFVDAQGSTIPFVNVRRMAGANGAGISPGVSVAPWRGGRIGAEINYDNVRYDNINSPDQDAKGLGGTVKIKQALTQNVDLGLTAAARQPFNDYAANLDLKNVQFYGNWTLGLFGDYNIGKNTLPDTWNVGASANYFFDQRCPVTVSDFKGETVSQPIKDNLLSWTVEPAIYMPRVLAIVDESVT